MNRVYQKCPQCGSKECNDISCRLKGTKHKDAAPGPDFSSQIPSEAPEAAPIGYECAWPNA